LELTHPLTPSLVRRGNDKKIFNTSKVNYKANSLPFF